jgi:hypothetical protein
MSKSRWIFTFVVVSLAIALFIASHSTNTASGAARPGLSQQAAQVIEGQCILTTDELHSLHAVSLPGQSIRIMETGDGPLGYEGGYSALSRCR